MLTDTIKGFMFRPVVHFGPGLKKMQVMGHVPNKGIIQAVTVVNSYD